MNKKVPPMFNKDASTCIGMVVILLASALIALSTVTVSPAPLPISDNPTPLGYTWSLALFILPATMLGLWFLRNPEYPIQHRAFFLTLIFLVPLGFVLDILFAQKFFTFVNQAATLGIQVPVVNGSVPVEEFIFYIAGFLFALLLYIWCDEYWLEAYNVSDYKIEIEEHSITHVVKFHTESLLVGIILIATAIFYKRVVVNESGLPGYFIFLVTVAIVPSMFLFPTARPFINWRAFSVTFFLLLLIALLWEVTLASPYQWWGYQHAQMVGIYIKAWSNLPIEAVIVWIAVSYMTVIVYEVVKVFLALGIRWQEALFGQQTIVKPLTMNEKFAETERWTFLKK